MCTRKTGRRKWLAVGGLVMLAFGIAGCAALIVASVVGSLDVAGYEYANAGASTETSPQQQPSAQPTLSLNDVE
jgi:hypothetical protein